MTHAYPPLEIAEIEVAPRLGCIGIAPCPGRGMRKSAKLKADRNLGTDLQQIRDWGVPLLSCRLWNLPNWAGCRCPISVRRSSAMA